MRYLTLPVLTLLISLSAWADPDPSSQSSRIPEERPRMENYADPERFVADVLAWEKQQKKANKPTRQHSSGPYAEGNWHQVTGPEKLDEALRNAYGYTQPNYQEKYRFNRTTHLSFPLERLESGQLSGQAITGVLQPTAGEAPSLEPLPELESILQETREENFNTARYDLDHGLRSPLMDRTDRVHVQAR